MIWSFPRLYAAASLKPSLITHTSPCLASFPRLYAAASLKHLDRGPQHDGIVGFPRLYAAASLKRLRIGAYFHDGELVFRGFMPRPH